MKVRLVSSDLSLYRSCREALLPLDNRQWDFGVYPTWEPDLTADVWIWDCDSNEGFPSESWLQEEHKIIFVVDRSRTVLFRDLLPVEAVRILLKPVRPGLLEGFLKQMLAGEPASRAEFQRSTSCRHDEGRTRHPPPAPFGG